MLLVALELMGQLVPLVSQDLPDTQETLALQVQQVNRVLLDPLVRPDQLAKQGQSAILVSPVRLVITEPPEKKVF